MEEKTFFQRYALFWFFFFAYLISWGGAFLIAAPKFFQGVIFTLTDVLPMALFVLLGPSLAGTVMIYLTDGTYGLRDLFARMKNWRVGAYWYAVLLIFPILITVVSLILAVLVSPDFIPTFFVFGVLMGLFAGFFEEIGWMGFAYPKMALRYTILSAGILLGFLWGLWHLIPSLLGNYNTQGVYWLPHFFVFVLSMIAVRFLIVWVYANTKSLLLSMLMHASSTGFLAVIVPMTLTPVNWVIFYSVYALVLWVVAATIIMKYGKKLVKDSSIPNPVQEET